MSFINDFLHMITDSYWHWDLILMDIVLVMLMLIPFKYTLGFYSGVSVRDEIAEKDNPAFGLVIASALISFFLIMSGVSTGDGVTTFYHEAVSMISYGFAGILMLLISKIIFDKVSMHKFCMKKELSNRNVAAAIVDSGNLIATSLIVFAYMSWDSNVSIFIVAYGWILSQLALSIGTYIRIKLYKSENGESLYQAIESGNTAVAIRFTGYRLSMAFAPIIALPHFSYVTEERFYLATMVFLTSMVLSTCYVIITSIIKKIVFSTINFANEINVQRNTGLAFVEAFIVIGLTILNYGLLK